MYWTVLCLANIPVYFGLGKLVFGDWDGFLESLKYVLMPDIWSWMRGEALEDWWSELKFLWWILCCAAVVALEHFVILPWVL